MAGRLEFECIGLELGVWDVGGFLSMRDFGGRTGLLGCVVL